MAKSYPDIGTFTSGQILTAATMNDVGTNLDNLRVPPSVSCGRGSDLSYTSGDFIPWTSESFDTDGMHDNSTNNTRITFSTAGLYMVTYGLYVTYSGTLNQINPGIRKNGTTQIAFNTFPMSKTTDVAQFGSFFASFAASDYIEMSVGLGGSTSNLIKSDARTFFAATWLGQVS